MELTFNPNASKAAIEAAKKLIERYNEITIDDVDKHGVLSSFDKANKLTGYGMETTCILCTACNLKCIDCIYDNSIIYAGCSGGLNKPTFDAIDNARTARQLVFAFKNRAAHISKIVELIEKHQQSCN